MTPYPIITFQYTILSMTDKVRRGVIGIGNMGSAHAKSIIDGQVPGLELAAVADVSA